MNTSKSKMLVKGLEPRSFVVSLGLKFDDKIKHLGVIIGHVTKKDIYGFVVLKSFIRAQAVHDVYFTGKRKCNC